MNLETAPFVEGRGPYWPDACTTSDQACPTAYSGEDRVRMQRRWPGIPVVCRCHPHPAGVKAALLHPGTPLANECDRRLADELTRIAPHSRQAVIDSDAFTARVIRHALAEGITQFLDLGSGHITTSAAHAAVAAHPAATIVHVDHDPHVDDHNLAYLTENPILATRPRTLIHGNAFAIGTLLTSLYRTGTLDPSRPVCVLLIDILYYLEAANDARSVIRRLVKRLPPRSWIAVTHLTNRALPTVDSPVCQAALRRDTDRWCQAMARCVPPHPQASSRNEFARRIADLELLPPMITTTSSWPEPDTTLRALAPYTLAAVGRVPEPTTAA
ncbi:SAM-dependent methyltransferase [Amycolatopsis sp. NPDC049868]|uniref:SAM-dependent methyltransferase n=1 Tax=Amycolatopsis sp. NPDC049868 TaxID=3363934 RepID=UPI0037B84AC6